MIRYLSVLLLIVLVVSLQAQDSLQLFGNGSLRIRGGLFYQSGQSFYPVEEPDYPHWGSYNPSTGVWKKQAYADDNPLYHGAMYFDIDGMFEAVPGVRIQANLIGEHRGMSYGVYDSESMILYPKIHVAADTAYYPFNERLEFHASTGHVTDGRLYEGLTFYNLDWQGSNFWVKWRNFKIEYHKIGDLSEWIGLGLGDADDWMFSAEAIPLIEGLKADARIGTYTYTMTGFYGWQDETAAHSINGTTVSLGIFPSDRLRIYGQFGIRSEGMSQIDNISRSAVLAGVRASGRRDNLTYSVRCEYRHYDKGFNAHYVNTKPGATPYHSGNSTIGAELYPISFYKRPFGQWAIFTEYVDENIAGASLYIDAEYRLPFSLVACLEIDLNQMLPETSERFLWAFYDAGLGWSPAPGILFKWSATNKGMNLERHFPTFYMYKEFASNLTVEWDVPIARW